MTDFRLDYSEIRNWTRTPEGYAHFLAPVAREGWLTYRNSDGSERREWVSRETLRRTAHTFTRKPYTDLHPDEAVTGDNATKHAKGMMHSAAKLDKDGVLWLDGTILDREHADAVEAGERREISCGYAVVTVPRADGTWEQVDRKGNHVAGVPRGRAGPGVAFRVDGVDVPASDVWISTQTLRIDADPVFEFKSSNQQEDQTMETVTVPISLNGAIVQVPGDAVEAIRRADEAIARLTADNAAAAANNATLTTQLSTLQADSAAAATASTAEIAKLRQDCADLQAAEKTRADAAPDLSKVIAERIDLWGKVLPIMRADNAGYTPDYALDSLGIMREAVSAKFPGLKPQLDALDLGSPEAQGMIRGIFATLPSDAPRKDSASTVDTILGAIAAGRADQAGQQSTGGNDQRMDQARANYTRSAAGSSNN